MYFDDQVREATARGTTPALAESGIIPDNRAAPSDEKLESVEAWIRRCDARSEPQRHGNFLRIKDDHVWDPYNEAARRLLHCVILSRLRDEGQQAEPPLAYPRIVGRRNFPEDEIHGVVSLYECGSNADQSQRSDFDRIMAGMVRECGFVFGYCVLQVNGPVPVAVLLEPGDKVPEVDQSWSLDNRNESEWNIIAGPCIGSACPYCER